MTGPLHNITVIDASTSRGELAGRLLADLGARVIKLEPPVGAQARRLPPFDGAGESLYWQAVGRGKESLVLDPLDPDQHEDLLTLLAGADIFIESFDPGRLAAAGLGYDALHALLPRLIYVSITPFGQTGPKAKLASTEFTLEAAGGLMNLQGDGDRPPIPVGFPQAAFHAGAQAAADAIIALNACAESGVGQWLDVSMQSAIIWTLMNAAGFPPMTGEDPPGTSAARSSPAPTPAPGVRLPRTPIPCADGFCVVGVHLRGIGERSFKTLLDTAIAAGHVTGQLPARDWNHYIDDLRDGVLAPVHFMAAMDGIEKLVRSLTKAQLRTLAMETGALLAPVLDVADLLRDPHLAERNFWTANESAPASAYPGPFALLSRTPVVTGHRAPALGNIAKPDLKARSTPARQAEPAAGAFAGLKVADFAWVGVGPIISRALADHGATVIHVESALRPDVLRQLPPFKDGEIDPARAHFHANFNTSKQGLALNLATDEGRGVARELADWADVIVESFTPGTMAKLGLDFNTLSAERSDLIMLSTCMRGQTGPDRRYAGFGNQGAAFAGLISITGWPDRPPVGPWGAYTDFITPRYGVAALSAALLERRSSGLGQHIDLSQIECGIQFMEPLLLLHAATGEVAGPVGHESPFDAFQGVFLGNEQHRYLALSIVSDEHWRVLSSIVDKLPATLPVEPAARADARATITAWCARQNVFRAADLLANAGVPAHVVARPTDLHEDEQLAHRGYFVTLPHAEMGEVPFDGLVTRFSGTATGPHSAGPLVGQHSREILRKELGMTDAQISQLEAAGALH